ncbi:hypothetical protein JW898_05695 [Candidatus Woesearchaeota archaeon]|nr:hypothetical protein [Candidatus Woesearchaeota archaeon]
MKKTKSQEGIIKAKDFAERLVPCYIRNAVGKTKYSKIRKPSYKYYGKSGLPRTVDLIVGKNKGFVEIKYTSSDKEMTYRQQVDRAFTELYDLKAAYPSSRIFLVINKEPPNKKHSDKYRSLAKLINLNFINIYSKKDLMLLKRELNKILK